MPSNSGYIGSRPDVGWWVEQIRLGKEYRQKQAYEADWPKWREYYRNKYRKRAVQPVNVFYMYIRSVVPRIYFRNPTVSVSPAMPGPLNMAFAQVLNRIDNKLLLTMGVKRAIKSIVQDTVMFGTGIGKLGYGALFNVTGFDDDAPLTGKQGERVEYDQKISSFTPWFKRISPKMFIVQAGAMTADESRFLIHEVKRDPEDVKKDPRFNTHGVNVKTDTVPEDNYYSDKLGLVTLFEVYDRKTDKVFVIAPNLDTTGRVLVDPTVIDFSRPPLFTSIFNPDDDAFWGIPDLQILEPHQLEINEINTQIMKHRRLSIIKLLAGEQSISEEEIEKMVSEDVGAVVRVKTRNPQTAVMPTMAGDIPQSLIVAKEEVMQIIRETLGFSRNQFGEYMGGSEKPTAEEAATVRAATDIRMDERRDVIADMLVDLVGTMNELLFKRWDANQVVDVVGPGGSEVWVRVNPSTLGMGKYAVKIDPDSSIPLTQAQREGRAAQIYQLFKDNPLIDPVKLTQMVITELGGVQLDDLMKMMPAVPGQQGSPGSPIGPEQLAGMIQQSMGAAQANPQQMRLPAMAGR